jgi:rubredoxin
MIVAAGRGVAGSSTHGNLPSGAPITCARVAAGTETQQVWMCTSCGFIYDPGEGDPDGGIPPGTAFDDIPDTWFCPVCGARKADFEPFEE